MSHTLVKMKNVPNFALGYYLVGEDTVRDSEVIFLNKPVRILEIPMQKGQITIQYHADRMSSFSDDIAICLSSVEWFRYLDEKKVHDKEILELRGKAITGARAEAAGLVAPSDAQLKGNSRPIS